MKILENNLILEKNDCLVFRRNNKGLINYFNEQLLESSLYEKEQMIGLPYNTLRDFKNPESIKLTIEESLNNKVETWYIVKNKTKDDKTYWIAEYIIPETNSNNEIESFIHIGIYIPEDSIEKIEKFENNIYKIDSQSGIESGRLHLLSYLQTNKLTYDKYVLNLLKFGFTSNIFFKNKINKIKKEIIEYDKEEYLRTHKNAKMYRGQLIIDDEKSEDEDIPYTEESSKPNKQVKMYRGQIIEG